jgi:hypothetical protein
MANYDLEPSQILSYGQQRRAAMQGLMSNLNTVDRYTQQADQNYGREFNQAQRSWDNARSGFPTSFNQRGLLNSGIYNRAMREFDASRQEAFGKLAQDYYNQRANYADMANNYRQNYENTYGDIADMERLNRAQIAANINRAM